MVMKESTMLPLGVPAPEFNLSDTDGRLVTLKDFEGAPALLVMFICNHCPYVIHVRDEIKRLTDEYMAKGVGVVGFCSNSVETHPQDGPDKMAEEKKNVGYAFPYLFDASQEVAKAYCAACTPDFYVFNQERLLVYRGQLDNSRPGNDTPVTGSDLRAALDAVLSGEPLSVDQKPSAGCNIKWKPGNEPDYF